MPLKVSALWTALALASSLTLCACRPDKTGTVETTLGGLTGIEEEGVNAYLGVPYAEAPTGDLRWAPPVPKQPWTGNRKAYSSEIGCVQTASPSDVLFSGEDCLYLDIWAPTTPGPHPVMVWIPGGGFVLGSGSEAQYNGARLAREQDMVVVSLNYRLGYLGLLAHPELSAELGHGSGNQAFLDQLEALRFVKREITAFGGDPRNMTLFGESAGATSVCVLMASPLGAGLFQHAILQSGSCDSFGTQTTSAAEAQGIALFERLGCPAGPGQLACARAIPEKTMRTALRPIPNELFVKALKDWAYVPSAAIDNHLLSAPPRSMLAHGINTDIDVLLGSNTDEGTLFIMGRNFVNGAEGYATYLTEHLPLQASRLLEVYPLSQYDGQTGKAVAALTGDGFLGCPTQSLARQLANAGHDVYNYQFDLKTSALVGVIYDLLKGENAPRDLGVFHSAEVPILFGTKSSLGTVSTTSEQQLHSIMATYWSNFARTGNPNGNGLPAWPRYEDSSRHYVKLADSVTTHQNLLSTQCDYWINEVYQAE